MIKTFADKETQHVFIKGKSTRLPPDLIRRAVRRLEYVHLATTLKDLRVPPSNRLHALRGSREGQYAISINDHGASASASSMAMPMTFK
ncbi:type II toxin-antitoxin system RelE/ParE family toxin [Desulfosarcina sp.]|uniref:type II toxin-antitoxin system RelE/ParE family toxin n=1 Tax=Desulfosarcina sp. TaxID=2027861 RepID=UPI00356525B4